MFKFNMGDTCNSYLNKNSNNPNEIIYVYNKKDILNVIHKACENNSIIIPFAGGCFRFFFIDSFYSKIFTIYIIFNYISFIMIFI